MVISPDSRIIIDIESDSAEVSADGMRKFDLERSDRIRISKDVETIQLVHLDDSVFTDRLVAKFKLPVEGWRGRGA
jgi:NAD+ kinase